jgi:uncharacterized protein YcbK (DUF882 family)
MSKYFKEIDDGNMDANFLHKLDKARSIAGLPFKINSAYRSPEHPLSIKNPSSSHIKGLAVDISVKDSRTRFIIVDALIKAGFNRIGIADTFIHVDMDLDKSNKVIWTY